MDSKANTSLLRAIAVINPEAFLHNINLLKQEFPGKKILAMVKGNCYGHGLELLNYLENILIVQQ